METRHEHVDHSARGPVYSQIRARPSTVRWQLLYQPRLPRDIVLVRRPQCGECVSPPSNSLRNGNLESGSVTRAGFSPGPR